MKFALKTIAASAMLTGGAASFAHVVLQPGPAVAGSAYDAAFQVGHACKDARSTTGLMVRLPRGFVLQDVPARAGWKIDIERGGASAGGTVRWTVDSPAPLPLDTPDVGPEPLGYRLKTALLGKPLTSVPGPL